MVFCPPCFCPADEEKLDERAKLSVAAKRSLFRVSVTPLPPRNPSQPRSRYFPPSSHSWEDLKMRKYSSSGLETDDPLEPAF